MSKTHIAAYYFIDGEVSEKQKEPRTSVMSFLLRIVLRLTNYIDTETPPKRNNFPLFKFYTPS